MSSPPGILIIQTAFAGDVILTLPLAEALKRHAPETMIDMVVVPSAAGVLTGHRALRRVIEYDKHGADAGLGGFFGMASRLKRSGYEAAYVPHRSIRSALLAWRAGIPRRIGFHTSAGKWFLTDVAPYDKNAHEIGRNLSLLRPLGIPEPVPDYPALPLSVDDGQVVARFLASKGIDSFKKFVTIAPGSVWNTKRWLAGSYASLAAKIAQRGYAVVLVGGEADRTLCESIAGKGIVSAAGSMSYLQSASLIKRSALLVSNDSAPVHLAGSVRTPVIAIFGPTVPSFGFAPIGPKDRVIERRGLQCRPCSIHGGDECPISTFVCMKEVEVEEVFRAAMQMLGEPGMVKDGARRN